MKIYLCTVGGFCLLYYLTIWGYSKRWNSTFVLFWPVAGTVHLILACLPLDGWFGKFVCAAIGILWAVFFLVEIQIIRAMIRTADGQVPYLIVLGAQVRGTRITDSLKRRLDAAFLYLEQNPGTKAIVSGGQGKGEAISEAEAMALYLKQKGIEENRILLEDASTSTLENLRFSSRFIDELDEPVAIVTNNFHMYRALRIGNKIGFGNLQGIAASSNNVFQLNYLVREFFAVIWMKLTGKHA